MILSTLQSRAARFLGDPDQTRYAAGYVDAINDAQKQFALDSEALFKDQTYTTAAGDSTYDLPADFILEDTVTCDGLPLKPASRHSLYTLYPSTDWTLLTGTPTHYMVDPEAASLCLRLIPQPVDVKTVSMRYAPLPADVSAGTDVVLNASTLLVQFHLGIAALAAWIILQGEIVTPEIQAKSGQMMKIYSDAVTKAIDKFGNTKSEQIRLRPKR
jgi:hypothetical protein